MRMVELLVVTADEVETPIQQWLMEWRKVLLCMRSLAPW